MRPRILCLHGEGCSGAIFQAQSRQLQAALAREFDFVFVDGPFPSPAGPGVLPFFEGPYYRWINRPPQHASDTAAIRALINHVVETKGPFQGIMAFSQGGRVATSLLQQQQQGRRRAGEASVPSHMAFGLLLSSTYPPLPLEINNAGGTQGITGNGNEPSTPVAVEPLVTVPTVHVHGRRDPWRPASRELLARCFDQCAASLVEFTGGHHCPQAAADVEATVVAVRQAYSKGRKLLLSERKEEALETAAML